MNYDLKRPLTINLLLLGIFFLWKICLTCSCGMPRKYFPNSRKHFPNSSRLLISISVITLHLVGPCKEKEKQEGKMVFAF